MLNRSKCVIPNTEGSIYSIYKTKQLLNPGSFVNQNQVVNEDCETEYHKVDGLRIMRCVENGQWEPYFVGKSCLSK